MLVSIEPLIIFSWWYFSILKRCKFQSTITQTSMALVYFRWNVNTKITSTMDMWYQWQLVKWWICFWRVLCYEAILLEGVFIWLILCSLCSVIHFELFYHVVDCCLTQGLTKVLCTQGLTKVLCKDEMK